MPHRISWQLLSKLTSRSSEFGILPILASTLAIMKPWQESYLRVLDLCYRVLRKICNLDINNTARYFAHEAVSGKQHEVYMHSQLVASILKVSVAL